MRASLDRSYAARSRGQLAYLAAVEPIGRERMRLRLLARTTIIVTQSGAVIHETLPPEIQAIDDKYVELIKQLHDLYLTPVDKEIPACLPR